MCVWMFEDLRMTTSETSLRRASLLGQVTELAGTGANEDTEKTALLALSTFLRDQGRFSPILANFSYPPRIVKVRP